MIALKKIQKMNVWTMLAMCLFGLSSMVDAANGVGIPDGREPGPPFRAGEVAVYATPQELPGQQVLKFLTHAGISVIVVEPGREMALVKSLRGKGRRAGLNHVAHAFADVNDPFYKPYQWHLTHIQSESAWDLNDGTGVTVAVLDTGLNTNGLDGISCVISETDIVNDDNLAFDGDGHGTHVSGTIAQNSNNNTGVAGMAYGACVMPVKVLDDTGSGSFADIANGIYYAVDKGAEVINMSLGIAAHWGITDDEVLGPALEHAYDNGVTVVCAAGNDGSQQNVSYPASHLTTIAVGATDFSNRITRYSNRGEGLDIMAPGGDTSTDANGDGYVDGVLQETDVGSGWGYYFFQGTSMASPHVAAVAAMLIANKSAITPDEVYQALTSTALDLGNPGFDSTYGYGLVQAHSAIQATSGNSNLDPTASFSFSCTGLSCDFDASESSDSDGSISSYDWNFGDDSTGTGLTSTHTYANSGTYTVTLTVWDNDGASGMSSQDVDVTVATSNTPPVTPGDVSAIDNSDGTASIDWVDYSNDEEGFQVEREKQNKRGQWKGRSVVATTEPGMESIVDPTGTGTFRYRIGAFNSAGISWSLWRDVTVTNTGSDGGSGSTPSKGYCKKNPDDPACP